MKTWIGVLCGLLVLASCKDEASVYPNVQTLFADVKTDSEGMMAWLVSDEGETWRITPHEKLGGLTPDSLYRTVTTFLPTEGQTATVYRCLLTKALVPADSAYFSNEIHTDAVDIRSIWRAGSYLNMVLLAKVKELPHRYHFLEEGIVPQAGGGRLLQLRLFHDSHGDAEAFTEEVYLSVPLQAYADTLSAGDSVVLRLNTFKEGPVERRFAY